MRLNSIILSLLLLSCMSSSMLLVVQADVCQCEIGFGQYYCFANDCNSTSCDSRQCFGCSTTPEWGIHPTIDQACISLCASKQASGSMEEKQALKQFEGLVNGQTNVCGTPSPPPSPPLQVAATPNTVCTSLPTSFGSLGYDFTHSGTSANPCSDITSESIDGSTCEVNCASGFVPSIGSAMQLTCDAMNNRWVGHLVCQTQRRQCTAPPITYSKFTLSPSENQNEHDCAAVSASNPVDAGYSCQVKCDAANGYTRSLTSSVEDEKITCQDDGTWSTNLSCESPCSIPTMNTAAEAHVNLEGLLNACFDVLNGHVALGASCEVKCATNYALIVGSTTLTCLSSGLGPLPTCTLASSGSSCMSAPDTAGMKVDLSVGSCKDVSSSNPLSHLARCSYGCAAGYHRAENSIQCVNGEWLSTPDCMSYPTHIVKLFQKLFQEE